jgi:Cu/Ag efflux protein CusF
MKFNPTTTALLISGALALAAPLAAQAQQPLTTNTTVATAPGKAMATQTTKASATVVSLDAGTRTVSLKTATGKVFDLVAGPEVRNFDQIKVGDLVAAEYVQALSLELKKRSPGSSAAAAPAPTVDESSARTAKGEKPGVAGGRQVTALADVVAVDTKNQLVTLRGPRGNQVDLNVQDPAQLKNIKKGDQVEVVYTEAVALMVVAAPKPAPKK